LRFACAPGAFGPAPLAPLVSCEPPMLCAKCQKNEATIHFTTVVGSRAAEAVHLCKECAPPTGLENLSLQQVEALSIAGKKCEFCRKGAFSGEMVAGRGAIYWCFGCGLEFGRILMELIRSERPDLIQRSQEESSFLSFCSDPELQAWSAAASQKAVQILRERRRQDGRDKGS
jgi:hypothetical protein